MADKTAAVEVEIVETHEFAITKMQQGSEIEANFDDITRKIAEISELYAGAVVTLDYLPQAKKDRACLNGLVKSVEQRRIEAKKHYMAPYDAFEQKVKVMLAPLNECSANLDRQIKALEEQERIEKREHLKAHYEGMAGALADAVPFERIEEPKWLNKTCHLEEGYREIEARIERIFNDEQTLDSLTLSHGVEAKAEFFATLDLSRAIARSKQLDEQEERARRMEEQKAANLAALKAPEPEPAPAPPVIAPEPPRTWTFECTCTRAQFDGIITYLKAQGIQGRAKAGDE